MPNQSVEARLASLTEASVELDTVWREILRPGRAGEPDEELVRRHEQALRLVLDADQELRDVTGLRPRTD
jgi:hypothetical protein